MKIVAIGDTHGRDDWKTIVEREKDVDKFVFIGDYFDTHEDIRPVQQIRNFKEIVEFKETNPNNVVLLVGNHEFHYIPDVPETYSGHQPYHHYAIQPVLMEKFDNLVAAHLEEVCNVKYLFSHAGLSHLWCGRWNIPTHDVVHAVNTLFKNDIVPFMFYQQDASGYGNHPEQGPLWVRPDVFRYCRLQGYYHVVGHTPQKTIKIEESIAFIDAINCNTKENSQYLVIDEQGLQARNIINV